MSQLICEENLIQLQTKCREIDTTSACSTVSQLKHPSEKTCVSPSDTFMPSKWRMHGINPAERHDGRPAMEGRRVGRVEFRPVESQENKFRARDTAGSHYLRTFFGTNFVRGLGPSRNLRGFRSAVAHSLSGCIAVPLVHR